MMNLATRCTACGTIFRVVQDQLKVSDGWVRCGRCQAVFNAQQGLFDLEREAPPPWQPATDVPQVPEVQEAAESPEPVTSQAVAMAPGDGHDAAFIAASEPEADAVPAATTEPLPPADLHLHAIEPEAVEHLPFNDAAPALEASRGHAEDVPESAEPIEEPPAIDPTTVASMEAPAAESPRDAEASAEVDPAPAATDEDVPETTPEFVRQAQRDERREQAPMRAGLWVVAVLAVLGLASQATAHFRHRIASQWPDAAPWLQRYCATVGCQLDALQRIDDVSIESTALTQASGSGEPSPQADGASNALRLAVTLRNRGPLPIAMPSVDLSLTGADGELVSRRSLSPRDFQVGDPQLAPGVDAPLSVNFSVTGRRVSGYTVEVFYP